MSSTRRPLVPALAAGAAVGLATSLAPGTPQQQFSAAVLVLSLSRLVALLPDRRWGPWLGLGSWGVKVSYATCAIIRSAWSPTTAAAVDMWRSTAPLGNQQLNLLIVLAAYGLCDWVLLRRLVPQHLLVLMSTCTTLLGLYPACKQLPLRSCLSWGMPDLLCMVLLPWLLLEVVPRLLHHARSLLHTPAPAAVTPPTQTDAGPPKASLPGQHATPQQQADGSSSSGPEVTTQPAQHTPAGTVTGTQPAADVAAAGALQFKHQPAHGGRLRVAVKVNTQHLPRDLPRDLAHKLQAGLKSSGLHVVGLAARAGCIAISLDLLRAAGLQETSAGWVAAPPSGPAAQSHGTDEEEAARHVGQQLLQLLQPLLSDHTAAPPGKALVSFQVGQTLLRAEWGAAAGAWQLLPAAAPLPAPRLSLGVPQQLAPGQPVHGPATSTPSAAPAAATAAASTGRGPWPAPARSKQVVAHQVPVCAELLVAQGSPPLSTAELAAVTGWEAGSSGGAGGQQHEVVEPASWRLLARCGTAFISTAVLEVAEPGTHSAKHAAILKVELQVPDWLLPRHHAGAAPGGLLPLVLELWQGQQLASSAPLLLHLPPAAGPSPNSSSCWWWGASSQAVQQAVQELQQAAATQLGDDSSSSREGWHALQDELGLWLEHLQHAATQGGQCTAQPPDAGAAAADLPAAAVPALTPSQAQAVGCSLMQFARANHMHGLQRMLAQQQAVLRGWPSAQASSSSRSLLQVAVRAVREAVLGAACEQCEARHRADMLAYLATVQHIISCAMAGSGMLRAACDVMGRHLPQLLMGLPWASAHLLLAVLHQVSLKGLKHSHQAALATGRGWLAALPLACRVAAQAAVASGVLPCSWTRGWPALVQVYITVALADQLRASQVVWPAWLGALALLDASVFALQLVRLGLVGPRLAAALLPCLCLPRLAACAGVRALAAWQRTPVPPLTTPLPGPTPPVQPAAAEAKHKAE